MVMSRKDHKDEMTIGMGHILETHSSYEDKGTFFIIDYLTIKEQVVSVTPLYRCTSIM